MIDSIFETPLPLFFDDKSGILKEGAFMNRTFTFRKLMRRQRSTLTVGLLSEGEYGELLSAWLLAQSQENLVEYITCLEEDTLPENHGGISLSYYELWKCRTSTL